ncbi:hypothetical protein FHJ31_16135 [Pseudomonas sp. Fig-3]|jgi:hypothetical protein|uniref:Uncharacterized protein n=1 Tax=Pseudomonas rhizophila TaxID=2045200 RepID=A0ABN5JWZ0_9PSED|nr:MULTISPECIES: hypothetical protein [Pseudomonas]AVU76613.1 hypothetical protein CRX69_15955 [Pseudomonas rhizophila]MBD0701613.1 hypothetical protein [Pseudomonas sp. PSB1]MDD2030454.1 hypothetical protein [Pseudomonas sp. 39167]MDR8384418.1 hypothetical protein [Pseudomonas sp. JL2]MEA1027629.1 hypothetical protein [Pseudomonas sp. N-137]
MKFYHYTTQSAAKSITDNQIGTPAVREWKCTMNQPQKWAWFKKQHEEGFYLTTIPPSEIREKKEKLGISKLSEVYVLYFNLAWIKPKQMKKVDDYVNSGFIKIKKVGEPDKICAQRIGVNTNQLDNVPFPVESCLWAGPVEGFPDDI